MQVGGRGWGDSRWGGGLFFDLGLGLAADLGQEGTGLLGREGWCRIGALVKGFCIVISIWWAFFLTFRMPLVREVMIGLGNAGNDLRDLVSLEEEEHSVEKVFDVIEQAIEGVAFRRRGIVVDCLRTADETGRDGRKEAISYSVRLIGVIKQTARTITELNHKFKPSATVEAGISAGHSPVQSGIRFLSFLSRFSLRRAEAQ